MKRMISLLMLAVLVFGTLSLAACDKSTKGALTPEELETASASYKTAYALVQQAGVTGYAICRVKGAKEQFLLLNAPAKTEDGTETPSFELIRLMADGTADPARYTLQFPQCLIDNKTGTLAIGVSNENGGAYSVLRYKTISTPTLQTLAEGEPMPGTPVEFFAVNDLRGLLPLNENKTQTTVAAAEATSADDAA